MNQRSKAFLVLAGIFDVAAIALLLYEETIGAGASVLGSIASLAIAYCADQVSPLAQKRVRQLPAKSGTGLPQAEYNALVAELARIDQQIEQTKKAISVANDRETEQRAEVALADLQNERYDVEAKLRIVQP